MSVSLLESTRNLLADVLASGVSLRQIAEGSEGAVNYDWLKKLAADKISDPGVARVESLNTRLVELKRAARRKAS